MMYGMDHHGIIAHIGVGIAIGDHLGIHRIIILIMWNRLCLIIRQDHHIVHLARVIIMLPDDVPEAHLQEIVDTIVQVEKVQEARQCHQVVANQIRIEDQVSQILKTAIPAQEMMDTLANQTVAVEEAHTVLHREALEAVDIVAVAVVAVDDEVVINKS